VILVSYLESVAEQKLILQGVSRRVYQATGEPRASWEVSTRHIGRPTSEKYHFAKMALSIRAVAAGNVAGHHSTYRVDNASPLLNELYEQVEGSAN